MTALSQQRPRDRRGVFKAGIGTLAAGMLVWTTAAAAALPSQGYAELVEKVSPAVVFISSDQKPDGPKTMGHGPAQRATSCRRARSARLPAWHVVAAVESYCVV